MTARRVIGGLGRLLILTGALILLFVAYQLWGTGLAEARSQDRLKSEFEAALAAQPDPDPPPDQRPRPRQPRATTTTTEVDPIPPPPEGEAVAVMRIPRIGLDKAVVQGVGVSDLKKGPGHYPKTPMPGQPGNAAIAGHRTTYGAPFFELDKLEPGDQIFVTTLQGAFLYRVTEKHVVAPGQIEVLDDFGDDRLTLTTCHPRYTARERLIVVAHLVGEAAPDNIDETAAPVAAEPDEETTTTTEDAAPRAAEEPPEDVAATSGLSGEGASNGPAILWGSLALLVLVLEWAAARWWRRWPSYLLITPVFLVVLFVFFENVSVLLPANV